MADEEGYLFSEQAVRKTAKAVKRVLGQYVNPPPQQAQRKTFNPIAIHPFVNESEEDIAIGSVMKVKNPDGFRVHKAGDEIVGYVYRCTKPDAKFSRHYAVCMAGTDDMIVKPGESGHCTFEYGRISHDSGWTPTTGQSGGPKPDSWLLWEGYPSICDVSGPWDADANTLQGSIYPITDLLCKATSALTAGIVDSDFIICRGSMDDDEDAGYTTLPEIELAADIEEDSFFFPIWVNGGWRTAASGGTSTARRFLATVNGEMEPGDSPQSITLIQAFDGRPLPDTTTVNATNILGLACDNGDNAIVTENRDEDRSHDYVIENVAHYVCEDL